MTSGTNEWWGERITTRLPSPSHTYLIINQVVSDGSEDGAINGVEHHLQCGISGIKGRARVETGPLLPLVELTIIEEA